jgi:hypothetical protein
MVDLVRAIQVGGERGGIDRVLALLGGRQVSPYGSFLNLSEILLADLECWAGW